MATSYVSPQHPWQVCIVGPVLVSLVSVEPVLFVESVVLPVVFVPFVPLLSVPDALVLWLVSVPLVLGSGSYSHPWFTVANGS